MTTKTIQELAEQAGLAYAEADGRMFNSMRECVDITAYLERFAGLVRAQALEDAAALIYTTGQKTPADYAAAIRALKAAHLQDSPASGYTSAQPTKPG